MSIGKEDAKKVPEYEGESVQPLGVKDGLHFCGEYSNLVRFNPQFCSYCRGYVGRAYSEYKKACASGQ
jgi:hypothetical protein